MTGPMPANLQPLAGAERAAALGLLRGVRPASRPCFSGLCSVTAAGLARSGAHFSAVHADAHKLAAAAATSRDVFGLASVSVPLDLCVEAEALGAQVDFCAGAEPAQYARVPQFPLTKLSQLQIDPRPVAELGRVSVVAQAIRLLVQSVGQQALVGAWVPGPFTLALYLVDGDALLNQIVEEPAAVSAGLQQLADFIARVARVYLAAGADFITVHEMGGSPGYVGLRTFRRVVQAPLQQLLQALPAPRVLSMCGKLDAALGLLAGLAAEAINIDHLTDAAAARAALAPGQLLFGNIDPAGVLAHGTPAQVQQAVLAAAEHVDAIWPGCDLDLSAPDANLLAMVAAARKLPS